MAGLGVIGIPEWAMPVLAQGDTVVQFTDIPENVRWETPPDRRTLDVRTIDGPFTPADKYATTQHYGHPDVDMASYKLKITGLVNNQKALTIDDLKKMGSTELVAGFECSGNRGPTAGAVRQRQMDRPAAEDGARRRRPQARSQGRRLLRRRPRRRGSRVADAEIQGRLPLRPQPCRAKRRSAPIRSSPGRSTASR